MFFKKKNIQISYDEHPKFGKFLQIKQKPELQEFVWSIFTQEELISLGLYSKPWDYKKLLVAPRLFDHFKEIRFEKTPTAN